MYLRHTTVRRGGKTHTYWSLVRSVRHGRRVRQEIVATLGRLDARGRGKPQKLAEWITGKRCQPSLFEPDDLDDDAAARIGLRKLHVERSRRFGDACLGLALWRSLELDEMFDGLLPEGREDVRWSTLAAIHVILRLCSPSSDLAITEDPYRKTALEDLLGVPAEMINEDRVYRALDRMPRTKRPSSSDSRHAWASCCLKSLSNLTSSQPTAEIGSGGDGTTGPDPSTQG